MTRSPRFVATMPDRTCVRNGPDAPSEDRAAVGADDQIAATHRPDVSMTVAEFGIAVGSPGSRSTGERRGAGTRDRKDDEG